MSRDRRRLLFFPFVLLLCLMLQLTHPHDMFMSQLTDAVLLFTVAGFGIAHSAVRRSERQDREPELPEKLNKEHETERKRREIEKADGHRVSYYLSPVVTGMMPASELRERRDKAWREAKDLVTTGDVREFDAKVAEVRALGDAIARKEREKRYGYQVPPAKQLRQLSNQYGLPVVTSLQKPGPLPLAVTPPVSAGGPARPRRYDVFGTVSDLTEAELAAVREHFKKTLKSKPAIVLPSTSMADFAENVKAFQAAVAGPEKEYVPEGQADLSRDLLDLLKEEVTARGGELAEHQSHFPSFHWFMSPGWLEEVRRVRTNGASGRLVYVPRQRTSKSKFEGKLYGYPVIVGDAFGVPELREP